MSKAYANDYLYVIMRTVVHPDNWSRKEPIMACSDETYARTTMLNLTQDIANKPYIRRCQVFYEVVKVPFDVHGAVDLTRLAT